MAMAKNGAMAAVVGLTSETLTRLLEQHQLTALNVANYNSPTQTVISGLAADIQRHFVHPDVEIRAAHLVSAPVTARMAAARIVATGARARIVCQRGGNQSRGRDVEAAGRAGLRQDLPAGSARR